MKNNKIKMTYIVAIIIMIIGVIGMILILKLLGSNKTAKVTSITESTTTSVLSTTSESITTTINEEDAQTTHLVVTNFSAPLSTIIGGYSFDGDYKVTKYFSGARFDFNCTSYDEASSTCVSGSGLMDVGTASIVLYTYDNNTSNYLNMSDYYYIIVNDNNIILTLDKNGSSGMMKIYNRNGEFISNVENVTTTYKVNDELIDGNYPSINESDSLLYYYACDGSSVKIRGVNLTNPSNVNYTEDVDGICN
ncbi:MAG TPA: hypothetical protein PLB45_00615 [Bacilli bacterium]|nr:hypothetical protein [Bacilli bacterium]